MGTGQRRVAGIMAVAAVLAVAAWMVVVPRLVAARLDSLLRSRLGWSVVRVEGVGIGLSGPIIQGLEVQSPVFSKLLPSTTRLELDWATLWNEDRRPIHLRGRTRFARGADVEWQAVLGEEYSSLALTAKGLPLAYITGVLPPLPWFHPESIYLDLHLNVRIPAADSAGREAAVWDVRGGGHLSQAALAAPLLADDPVTGMEMMAEFAGSWHPGDTRFGPFTARVTLPPVQFSVAGTELHWTPASYRVEMTASLPATGCADLLAAVPGDLLGEVAAFALAGTIQGRVRIRLDDQRLDATDLQVEVENNCRAVAVPAQASGLEQGTFTYTITTAEGGRHERTVGAGTPQWHTLPQVSPLVLAAVLVQEDAGFYRHDGFSLPAIRESLVSDLQAGGTRRGASTITMQLARNLFLHRHKTLARKAQEVVYTWWLEKTLGKDRILEMYLNIVEFGPRVYGIGAASRYYFQRDASMLNAAQAAFLAAILPAPYRAHREVAAAGALPAELAGQIRGLLRRMAAAGRLSPDQLRVALTQVADLHPATDAPPSDMSGETGEAT